MRALSDEVEDKHDVFAGWVLIEKPWQGASDD